MIKIRRMTIDDLPLGLGLSRQAGWNQTELDWQRFISMEPEGCFVAELDGSSVGTTTTCVFGHQVAWIAMVLVDKNVRGRGIGTTLLKHVLDYLSARKIETVRLDATPAGRPIYEKLGFVPEYELARWWRGRPGLACRRHLAGGREQGQDALATGIVRENGCGEAVPALRPAGVPPAAGNKGKMPALQIATPDVFSDLIEFDRLMTGTDRAKMLGRLFEEFPEHLRFIIGGDKLEGFITMRPGANAVQIGPCIATASAGPSLLSDALSRCAGKPVFVDIPLDNVCAVKIAESSSLKVQRCFTRMCLGERINDNVQAIWSSSGPEKG